MSAAIRPSPTIRRRTGQATLFAAAGLTLAACAGTLEPAPVAPPGPVAAGPQAPPPGTQGQPSPRYNGYKVGQPYQVHGVWYYPKAQPNYDEIGIASWYGEQFHNHYTADGEVFDMRLPSAAHTTLPLPSLVEVTNLANGKKLIVRVNDRGPFVDGRIIDLSKEAAAELGFVTAGVTKVRVRYIGQAADPPGYDPHQEMASARRTHARSAPVLALAAPPRPSHGQTAASSPSPASPPPADPAQTTQTAQAAPAPSEPPAPAQRPLPEVDTLLADNVRATAAARATPATYELQAGTFPTEAAAWRFASSLTGGGLPEVQTIHDGGQLAWRVVVHGLANPAEAAQAKSQAIALGAPNIAIVSGS